MRYATLAALLLTLSAAPALAQETCQTIEDDASDAACTAAIAAEKDADKKADLLFLRAYARVEAYDYDGALTDLTQVLALSPNHSRAYHERAYIFAELGDYQDAEDSLDAEVRLTPDAAQAYTERGYARFFLGDLAGAFEDNDRWVKLDPGSALALLARGRAHAWLGRFREARMDIGAAETLSRTNPDADADSDALAAEQDKLVLWTRQTPNGDPAAICAKAEEDFVFSTANLIGDCTAAYLAATDNKTRAAHLFVRAYAWLDRGEDEAAAMDMRFMIALEPDNAGWKSNLGYFYLRQKHSWAAEREFDRAIAIEPTYYYLAGRGFARFNQGKLDEAAADANASYALEPNALALTVLGDVALKRDKDTPAAKRHWLAAYHLGSREDGLLDRLETIGVTDPDKEPAE